MSNPEPRNRLQPESAVSPTSNGTNGHVSEAALNSGPSRPPGQKRTNAGNRRSGDLTFTDLASMIRAGKAIVLNRWKHGLIAAVLVTLGLGFAVSRMQREYIAVTTMVAESELETVLRPKRSANKDKTEQENLLYNRLSLMKSRRFSHTLASEFTREEMATIMRPYLKPGVEPTQVRFERFLALQMGANRERGREFFVLHFTHRDRNTALMVADRMAATYLKVVQVDFRDANVEAAELLESKADQLAVEITALENEKSDYRKKHNLVSLEENQGILASRLRTIDQSRAEQRIKLVGSEIQLREAEEALAANPVPFDNPILAGFGNIQDLRQELDGRIAEREVLSRRYGPNHAKMRDNDAAIRGLQETITNNFDLALRELKSQVAETRAVEHKLEEEFTRTFGESVEIARLANHFRSIEAEIKAKRENMNGLLTRVSSASIAAALPTDVMRTVDPAYIAQSNSRKQQIGAGIVFVLACCSFVGVPLLLNQFDDRISVSTDLEAEIGKELLGGVPRLADAPESDRPHVVRDNVDFQMVEPFMAIVAELELSMKPDISATFLITSATSGEGKSTIASNLAAGFSRIGKRTLLVDADCRNPTQQSLPRAEDDRGFLTWIRAGFPKENLFSEKSPLGIRVLSDGVHLLATGGDDPQPTKYLVSPHVDWLFKELQQRYDVLIVDTPPAGMFRDALVLTKFAQKTLFVARQATARLSHIRLVIASLEKSHSPVGGIIVNCFSALSLDPRLSYSYSYDSYYTSIARKKKGNERDKKKLVLAD